MDVIQLIAFSRSFCQRPYCIITVTHHIDIFVFQCQNIIITTILKVSMSGCLSVILPGFYLFSNWQSISLLPMYA